MYLYTERKTGLICEVKMFDGFVLVRPVDPAYYTRMEKVDTTDFVSRYEEYSGSYDDIRMYLAGVSAPVVMQ